MKCNKDKVRLDKYLSEELNISRSKVQKLIKEEKILVNDISRNNNYVLSIDDEIKILETFQKEEKIIPQDIPLNIVYEDEYLLVINKESGMVVHPGSGNSKNTLVNALLYKYDMNFEEEERSGIVHRIDKDTSGLMIVSKTEEVSNMLKEMIKNKEVERTYIALVDGIIPNETGTIDAPIGRDPNNRQKMTVIDTNSKNAVTNFTVLKRFDNVKKTLIRCKLDTGRTHQIRVHMNYIGYPIYNDPVYNNKKTTPFGQFLHSISIRFNHPITKKELYLESDVPNEFRNYLEEIENI